MKPSPRDMGAAWRKAEQAVEDIGEARRSAENAVEDVLDALRALRHHDDRTWLPRRDARRPAARAGDRLRDAAATSSGAITGDRLLAFAAGAVTGLVAGWWLGKAVGGADVRESADRFLRPVAETSRRVVERQRETLRSAVEKPVVAVRTVVGTSDDGPDGDPPDHRVDTGEGAGESSGSEK